MSRLKEQIYKLDAEHVILLSLLVVSAWMFLESYGFREPSGLFPRFTAAICLIGATLIVMRNYLPAPVKAYIEQEQEMFDTEEISQIAEGSDQQEGEKQSGESDNTAGRPQNQPGNDAQNSALSMVDLKENKPFILSILTLGYVLLSYLIGFLWATPLFVVSYSIYAKNPKYVTIILVILTFSFVYGFMVLLNVPLDTGYLEVMS